jgi:queuine/archaeosine tRNA-ribosyltransferase
LETLKNFDEKISFSKQEAQKAELLKPDTLENIDKSRALVKNIRENIQTQSFNEFNPVDIVS